MGGCHSPGQHKARVHAHMHTYTSIHRLVHAQTPLRARAHMHKLTYACRMGKDKLQTPLAWPPEGRVKVWPEPGTFLLQLCADSSRHPQQ